MLVRYAVKHLVQARARLVISLVAISFAGFLMAVQGSLLYGFTIASSRIVDAIDAEVFIVARDIPAFDFVSPIEERLTWLARGVPGVKDTGRGIGGWTAFEKPSGQRTSVFVVAIEDSFEGRTPAVRLTAAQIHGLDHNIATDETNRFVLLGDAEMPARVQVGGSRAYLAFTVQNFASFMGPPIVFADFVEAHSYLPYPEARIGLVAVKTEAGVDARQISGALQMRFPDVSVFTKAEFSWRSRAFWLIKTGAGAALLVAAVLGFLIGLSVVAQTIYSLSLESSQDYAVLKSMGATNSQVSLVVLVQSLLCGAIGGAIGLALVSPFATAVRSIVSWIEVPDWIYLVISLVLAILSAAAGLIAAKPAISADPASVFRA